MTDSYEKQVLIEFATFLKNRFPELEKVSLTYPKSKREASNIPMAVVDIVINDSKLSIGKNPIVFDKAIVRITILSNNEFEISNLPGLIKESLNHNSRIAVEFSKVKIWKAFYASPVIPAFEEKDNLFQRDIDVKCSWNSK